MKGLAGGSLASDSVQHLVSADGYEALNDNFTNEIYDIDDGMVGGKKRMAKKTKPVKAKGKKQGKSGRVGGSLASDSVQQLVSEDGYEALDDNFTNQIKGGGKGRSAGGCGCKKLDGGKKMRGGVADIEVVDTAAQIHGPPKDQVIPSYYDHNQALSQGSDNMVDSLGHIKYFNGEHKNYNKMLNSKKEHDADHVEDSR